MIPEALCFVQAPNHWPWNLLTASAKFVDVESQLLKFCQQNMSYLFAIYKIIPCVAEIAAELFVIVKNPYVPLLRPIKSLLLY